MGIKQIRKNFIDRTAREPKGKWAVKNYNDPKAHYKSFKIIMDLLKLKKDDLYFKNILRQNHAYDAGKSRV